MSNRDLAITAIEGERLYQEARYPNAVNNGIAEEIVLLDHYLGKLKAEAVGNKINVMPRFREIAALAVRAMENWGAEPRDHEETAAIQRAAITNAELGLDHEAVPEK